MDSQLLIFGSFVQIFVSVFIFFIGFSILLFCNSRRVRFLFFLTLSIEAIGMASIAVTEIYFYYTGNVLPVFPSLQLFLLTFSVVMFSHSFSCFPNGKHLLKKKHICTLYIIPTILNVYVLLGKAYLHQLDGQIFKRIFLQPYFSLVGFYILFFIFLGIRILFKKISEISNNKIKKQIKTILLGGVLADILLIVLSWFTLEIGIYYKLPLLFIILEKSCLMILPLAFAVAIFKFQAFDFRLRYSHGLSNLVVHDIKNLTINLEGFIEEMLFEENDSKKRKTLQSARITANILYRTSKNFLIQTKLNSDLIELKFENVEISNLINEAIETNRIRLNYYDIEILNTVCEIDLHADESLIRMLFNNLVDNAVNYAPSGSKIQIYRLEIVDKNAVCICFKNEKNSILKKQNIKSTGVGLMICKKILQKHNGQLQIKNHNKNIIVEITLPKK